MDGAQRIIDERAKAAAPKDPKAKAAPNLRPRDAATLIILDTAKGAPRILFGKRRMDQKFMPGKYVFPGGRVDAADLRVKTADELVETLGFRDRPEVLQRRVAPHRLAHDSEAAYRAHEPGMRSIVSPTTFLPLSTR